MGRLGDIETVRSFRRNIALVAKTSADAKQAWASDPSLDAWLILNIWQVANPTVAEAGGDRAGVPHLSGHRRRSHQAWVRQAGGEGIC